MYSESIGGSLADNKKIHELALKRFKLSQEGESENRRTALDSIRFTDGDQWPSKIKAEREQDGRPCLTNNKLRKFVKQVVADIRQNKVGVKVRPVDNFADVAGAEVRNDLIRHIEAQSTANIVYETGMEQALDGGFGYWRIVADYQGEEFHQEIRLKRVPNRFTVYLDQSAQDYNYEDGKFAFVTETLSKEDFDAQYPEKEGTNVSEGEGESKEGWFFDGTVRIAEYFYKDPVTKTIAQLDTGEIIELDKTVTVKKLAEAGMNVKRTREVKGHKVMWCKMTGSKIIEGPKEFPSKYIPVVPVLGLEINDEGKRKFRSLIYDAMDSMRMYNFWTTHATETIALAPKSPYLVTPEQIEGHEDMWKAANVKNYPYLIANYVPGHNKPERVKPPDVPAAALSQMNTASADIMDTIGMYQASLGQESNERSGRAIIARQKAGDAATYTFVDNFTRAIVYTGKILIDMMPKVYDNERVIRIRGEAGDEGAELLLNKVIQDPATLETITINDLSVGEYDIIPVAGPSYESKRQETAASMLDFIQFVPQSAPIIGPRLASVMDWPMAQEIAQELKMMVMAPSPGGGPTGAPPMPDGVNMPSPGAMPGMQ